MYRDYNAMHYESDRAPCIQPHTIKMASKDKTWTFDRRGGWTTAKCRLSRKHYHSDFVKCFHQRETGVYLPCFCMLAPFLKVWIISDVISSYWHIAGHSTRCCKVKPMIKPPTYQATSNKSLYNLCHKGGHIQPCSVDKWLECSLNI